MDNSPSKSEPPFKPMPWVKNLWEAQSLEDETLQFVAGFTLLWNIFEGCICETNANYNVFKSIANGLTESPKLKKAVDESILYYRCRYVIGGKMNSLFDGLNFRENRKIDREGKKQVEAVLRGYSTKFSDKVLALLIIVYRIRNNIFHGSKPAGTWNSQAENISEASRVLSIIIKANNLSS